MKKLLLLTALALSGFGVFAQTAGGPDLYGYVWRDSNDPNGPLYNWVEVTGQPETVTITGLADDNITGPYLLPAPFQYYWYTVDRFWVGSNGYISFQPAQISHPFPIIPTPNTLNNFLAGMMTDLNFSGAGNPANCYYWTSPAQDSVVITYDSVPFWTNVGPQWTGDNTFQIILNYNDSSITYQYKTQTGASASTTSFVTVGIENNSGTDGLMVLQDLYPPSQYSIRYVPPTSTTLQINDASTVYNDNDITGARFISKNPTGAFLLNTQVKNSGNTTLNPFSVTGIVRAANNSIQVSNTVTTNTLLPSQTQDIAYVNPFVPVNSGTFRFINTTTLPGDATPSNDGLTMELQVVDTTLVTIELGYDNGVAAAGGISWNGGDGGCANYFIPPFYPCDITKVSAYIVADPNVVGYYMKVYDDDGLNASAGTLLDSVFIPGGTFNTNAFTQTTLTQPLRIDSGGYYVAWAMAGDGVALGQNAVAPYSNRTFEILSGVMADYRYREIEDLMIRSYISRVGVGIEENEAEGAFGQFFPNPATDRTSILIDATRITQSSIPVRIVDLQGKLVSNKIMPVQNNMLELSLSGLAAGQYAVIFNVGDREIARKISIVR